MGDAAVPRHRWLVLVVVGFALLTSLVMAECGLRLFASRSTQAQEVGKIQPLLRAHPTLGYLWASNLSLPPGTLKWADQVPRALTTDAMGFFNDPTAMISDLLWGSRVPLLQNRWVLERSRDDRRRQSDP